MAKIQIKSDNVNWNGISLMDVLSFCSLSKKNESPPRYDILIWHNFSLSYHKLQLVSPFYDLLIVFINEHIAHTTLQERHINPHSPLNFHSSSPPPSHHIVCVMWGKNLQEIRPLSSSIVSFNIITIIIILQILLLNGV